MLLANDVKVSPTATVTAPTMVTIRQLNFSVKGAATGPAKKTSDLPKEPIQAAKRKMLKTLLK